MIWSMAYLENGNQFHLDQWQKNQNLVSSKLAFINQELGMYSMINFSAVYFAFNLLPITI